MNLTLVRTERTKLCTQGIMSIGETTFMTLERPWVPDPQGLFAGGDPAASCVPAGTYELDLHNTQAHPRSFALVNKALGVAHLPDIADHMRYAILIHAANYPSELEGCIALGLSRGACVINQSRAALDKFNSLVPWVMGHTLTITEQYP